MAAKKEKKGFFRSMGERFREAPLLFITYFVLRLLVLAMMVTQFFNKSYDSVFLCILTLFLFTLPSFVERQLKIDVPNTLEVIILLFIFCAEILGEIREYYIIYPYWDTILHTTNGFLCAAIGIAMIDILNRSERFAFKMSPFFVALVAFCFSMTVGVLWEFFEFAMDLFFHTDMQKDTLIPVISSVMLNESGHNVAVSENIESVVVNGKTWAGYIDIGLIDTMQDLFVNFIGAVVFSTIGFFYIKGRGKGKLAKRFIPTRIRASVDGSAPANAPESADTLPKSADTVTEGSSDTNETARSGND